MQCHFPNGQPRIRIPTSPAKFYALLAYHVVVTGGCGEEGVSDLFANNFRESLLYCSISSTIQEYVDRIGKEGREGGGCAGITICLLLMWFGGAINLSCVSPPRSFVRCGLANGLPSQWVATVTVARGRGSKRRSRSCVWNWISVCPSLAVPVAATLSAPTDKHTDRRRRRWSSFGSPLDWNER